ncbi:hypothetical protein NPS01_31960 [Nocardioides psychrotolerans]|uniref:Uncharacterized protein n=1 Tax=Nocardioides psychrotolerans TaxID=1005945 RepID=A0A1I3P4J4_9ACTN|nr:hypothetical protein [Nocardioides psychrotolerans]GEP39533.1 hypothetical protein NPS01_31960 [Nocardioides psychrotolerans]SFJ16260.1 hypothetical protein SAMN05216561_11978 [Nocardioides psychrotolerans]
MLRSATLGTLTTLVVTLGGVGVADATSTTAPTARTTDASSWGSTRAPDQVLRQGCRNYRFAYKITTPNNEWQAEVFVTDPRGRAIGSVLVDAGSNPRQDVRTFRTCRASTTPGRFKLRMRVTYTVGYEKYVGFVKPTYFRLTRPR